MTVSSMYTRNRATLLQDRMTAAFAVIGGFGPAFSVVVIEHNVLAFVADDVRDASKFLCVLGEDKRAWLKRNHHSGGVNKAARIEEAGRRAP